MSLFKNLFGKKKEADLKVTHDFTTPEGAILCLQDAFSAKNLEGVLACKDFDAEAKLMLQGMIKDGGGFGDHPALRDQTSKALRLSFIKHLNEEGYPDYSNVKTSFTERKKVNDEHVIVTEVLSHPDMTQTVQQLHVIKTNAGWRVLNLNE